MDCRTLESTSATWMLKLIGKLLDWLAWSQPCWVVTVKIVHHSESMVSVNSESTQLFWTGDCRPLRLMYQSCGHSKLCFVRAHMICHGKRCLSRSFYLKLRNVQPLRCQNEGCAAISWFKRVAADKGRISLNPTWPQAELSQAPIGVQL